MPRHRHAGRTLWKPFALTVATAAITGLASPATASATTGSAHDSGSSSGNAASYNGAALTPPMGWNDWYQYRCGITQSEVLANARALVTSGLAKLGYRYVNLDDCWMAPTRTSDGQLQADPTTFPNGIKWLADKLHAMGLKLGVYESAGTTTCQGRPGSWGHYEQDAQTFASWGVDFVKFDYCGQFPGGTSSADLESDYRQMSQDLLATGRHIVYSEELPVAAGDANPTNPNYLPYVSASSTFANMWRVAPDETPTFTSTVFGHLAADLPLARYAHPGAWNDLDMLLTGNTSFDSWTVQQQETQMSIWAEMASPLLDSSNLTDMTAATKRILGNKAVIAVDQDPLGKQGQLVAQQAGVDIVAKPLVNGDVAVLFANTSGTAENAAVSARTVGLPAAGAYTVQNLWTHSLRESAGTIAATVPADSAVLYRVAPLRGGVARIAPLTDIFVNPDVPPAYQGSQFTIAKPGQTIAVPATFTNDGRTAITHASLSVTAPTGWSVQGSPVSAAALPSGGSLDGTWQVTIPSDATSGTYTIGATASYRWNGTRRGTDSADSSIQVLVPPTGTPYLDQLTWLSATSSFDTVLVDKSYYGTPLTIHGVVYQHGLWANSIATIYYYLGGNCSRFTTDLGLDDTDKSTGAVDYQFYADGTKIYDSGVVTNSTPTVHASVNVSGAQILELYVGEGNGTINYGNADFGDPQLTCNS